MAAMHIRCPSPAANRPDQICGSSRCVSLTPVPDFPGEPASSGIDLAHRWQAVDRSQCGGLMIKLK